MDYVFLVMTHKKVVVELYVLTNSIGEVCAIRRADTGADGWPHVGDLIRAGHLGVVAEDHRAGRPVGYTVIRR